MKEGFRKIKDGYVCLFDNGAVYHWDGEISAWREGWGPYATTAALGEDERQLEAWRRQQAGRA